MRRKSEIGVTNKYFIEWKISLKLDPPEHFNFVCDYWFANTLGINHWRFFQTGMDISRAGGDRVVYDTYRYTTGCFLRSSGPGEPQQRLQRQPSIARTHDLQPKPLQVRKRRSPFRVLYPRLDITRHKQVHAFSQRTIDEGNRLPRECDNPTSVNHLFMFI